MRALEVIRTEADILCTAVGKETLPDIISIIANGLLFRKEKLGNSLVDIIIAENMRHVSKYFYQEFKEYFQKNLRSINSYAWSKPVKVRDEYKELYHGVKFLLNKNFLNR